MSSIIVFRKSSEVAYSPRCKGIVVEAIVETLANLVRVSRPGLVSAMLPTPKGRSEFARLAPITAGESANVAKFAAGDDSANAKAARATIKAKGIKVPADSLGRGKVATASQAQSVLLWIKDRLCAAASEHGVTVADDTGADLSVVYID